MKRLLALALLGLPSFALLAQKEPVVEVAPAAISVTGVVTKSDVAARSLTLKHAAITGLPAGETSFLVGAGDAQIYPVGTPLTGNLFRQGDAFKLEAVWPERPEDSKNSEDINRQLRRDTVTRGRKVVRSVGEYIPKVSLFNQNGTLTRWDVNRADYKVINFIFTRCPEPTKCPASTQRMTRLQEEAKLSDVPNLQLYSLSFDPENDTPGVLRDYATSHNLDTSNFTLMTGDKSVMLDLTRQFGIVHYRTGSTIDHTMATVLVNPHGKIIHRAEGSRWSVEDFITRIKADIALREAEEAENLPKRPDSAAVPEPKSPSAPKALQN